MFGIRRSLVLLLLIVGVLMVVSQPAAVAAPSGWTTLDVDGVKARIYRDEWGIPHIFAPSNRALFEAYGYTVAEDRLFQLEIDRRAARGTLAEVFGPSFIDADEVARRDGYTEAELDAQIARSSPEDREIFKAYIDGINRYISDVVLPDTANKLPYEFKVLGFMPAPWTEEDSAAFGAFMVRRFGEIGGAELQNQALLDDLVAAHGLADGWAMFNDLTWLNDADSPVTIPSDAQQIISAAATTPVASQMQSAGAGSTVSGPQLDEARQLWASLGVPIKLGSYAWAVRPSKSSNGAAMLFGGPQMGFDTPAVIHEVQLKGGNGFDVMGMAFAGVPPVLIGRNEDIAWTSTTATGDNVDTYAETLCGPTSYVFNGVCTPMEVRQETINVRDTAPGVPLGTEPQQLTVMRTVHGPVIALDQARGRRLQPEAGPLAAGVRGDSSLPGVRPRPQRRGVRRRGPAHRYVAQLPLRRPGGEHRLLAGGTGARSARRLRPAPAAAGHRRGGMAGRHHPDARVDKSAAGLAGELEQQAGGLVPEPGQRLVRQAEPRTRGPAAPRRAAAHIAARHVRYPERHRAGQGPGARLPVPVAVPARRAGGRAVDPSAGGAGDVVAAGVGPERHRSTRSTSTYYTDAYVIYWVWKDKLIHNVFGDEMGTHVDQVDANVLLHTLDGAASGVPPHVDYFNGADRETRDRAQPRRSARLTDVRVRHRRHGAVARAERRDRVSAPAGHRSGPDTAVEPVDLRPGDRAEQRGR